MSEQLAPPGRGQGDFPVRRIVVALDSSGHALAALEAAAALAARLQAEIEGVFVEDIDLRNLAGLPFGTEFSLTTGRGRPFDVRALEEQMHREIARARRALEAAAASRRVHSTFRVARGRVAAELIAAAEAADLLILGAAGHAMGFRFRPGRVALAAAELSSRPVLLLREGAHFEGRPLVSYDGSANADKALDAAAALARFTGNNVRVLVSEAEPKKAEALREAAARRLAGRGVAVLFEDALEATLDTMCRLIARTDADILVLAADDPRLGGEGCGRLLERLACPVLLVR